MLVDRRLTTKISDKRNISSLFVYKYFAHSYSVPLFVSDRNTENKVTNRSPQQQLPLGAFSKLFSLFLTANGWIGSRRGGNNWSDKKNKNWIKFLKIGYSKITVPSSQYCLVYCLFTYHIRFLLMSTAYALLVKLMGALHACGKKLGTDFTLTFLDNG